MTLRYIRRIIWSWQDWRARKKLERAVPGYRDDADAIRKARKSHGPVKHIYKRRRDAMLAVLAGRS